MPSGSGREWYGGGRFRTESVTPVSLLILRLKQESSKGNSFSYTWCLFTLLVQDDSYASRTTPLFVPHTSWGPPTSLPTPVHLKPLLHWRHDTEFPTITQSIRLSPLFLSDPSRYEYSLKFLDGYQIIPTPYPPHSHTLKLSTITSSISSAPPVEI